MDVMVMAAIERIGELVGAVQVFPCDKLMLISDQCTLVRTHTEEISILSRNTQGVRLIRLREGERLVGVEPVAEEDEEPAPEGVDEDPATDAGPGEQRRSEEHTSELQSRGHLVCRLLL